MTVGYPVNKEVLDRQAGSLVAQLRSILDGISRFKGSLDGFSDADLTAMGYTQTEVDFLQACFADLENMRLTIIGQRAQSPASNFLFNAGKLTGVR